ncbi:hypothetical protein Pst134EB_023986 [Puccinia striiformis f. sp. tritici]|nr:hypothetical protein Pst134EB_023986 [Puccinia striiformis f. sp. tritici]
MTTWKVVYDKLSHSGSAGLHEVLAQEKLAESAWNMLNDMHQTNPGAHAYGHTELSERIEELVEDLGDQSDSADDEEAARPTPRRRRGEAGLTAAELALDDDVDAALPSGETKSCGCASSGTQATPTNAVGPDTRPPKGVDAPSRRRGRTEQVKPDDSASSALLMMMHKSQERQEQQRLDERARVRAGSRKTGEIGDREGGARREGEGACR